MKIAVAVAVATTILVAPITSQAKTKRACLGWQYRAEHRTPPEARERRVRRLIGCVFREVGLEGYASSAVGMAERESGLFPWAVSWTGCCKGLFQHHAAYWSGRVAGLPLREFPNKARGLAIFQQRANTWAAALMVRNQGGWCPAWC